MSDASDLLAFIAGAEAPPAPEALCAFVVRATGAERGFLVVEGSARKVWAVDLDGFALGHGGERLPVELLPTSGGIVARRAEPTTALALQGPTGMGQVTLLLEHRFRPYPLEHLTDADLRSWWMALVVGLRWSLDAAQVAGVASPPGDEVDSSAEGAPWDEHAEHSLAALESVQWNISRAARHLGITRHGLKKRIRRYGLHRPSEH